MFCVGLDFCHSSIFRRLFWCRGCIGSLPLLWDTVGFFIFSQRISSHSALHSQDMDDCICFCTLFQSCVLLRPRCWIALCFADTCCFSYWNGTHRGCNLWQLAST